MFSQTSLSPGRIHRQLVPIWNSNASSCTLAAPGEYVCGSDADCDLQVSLTGVAARHCRITVDNTTARIEPLVSSRLWVNDIPVTTAQRLIPGDVIAIGPATFRFENGFPEDNGEDNQSPRRRRPRRRAASSASEPTVRTKDSTPAEPPSAEVKNFSTDLDQTLQELERRSAVRPPTIATPSVTPPTFRRPRPAR